MLRDEEISEKPHRPEGGWSFTMKSGAPTSLESGRGRSGEIGNPSDPGRWNGAVGPPVSQGEILARPLSSGFGHG